MGSFSRKDAIVRGVRQRLEPHAKLLNNATSLTAGAIASSVLGFAYWWVAARCFPLYIVGLTAAAVSIMLLIAVIAELGLGTMLLGESLVLGEKALGLISAALSVSFVSATLLGMLFIFVARAVPLDLGRLTSSADGALYFALGCGVTTLAEVLGKGFAGLLRSSFQMYQKVAFSLIKLLLLILVAAQYGSGIDEGAVFATWVGGQVLSVSIFALVLRALNRGSFPVPRFTTLRPLVSVSLSHHVLDLVTQAPTLVMPFLVTVMLSPAINAAFYVAWMILQVTFLPPLALTSMIFATGQFNTNALASRFRLALILFAAGALGVWLVFFLFSGSILRIFSEEYATIAESSMRILGLSYFCIAIRNLYIAVRRIKRQMLYAARILALGGIVELVFAVIGGNIGGLPGLCAGWTAATLLQAIFMAPAVLHAATLGIRK